MTPLFLLSTMPPLNGQADRIALGDPTVPLPYAGLVDMLVVELIVERLVPLTRAFLLGGFQVWSVFIGVAAEASPAAAPASWLRVDMATQQVTQVEDVGQLQTSWLAGNGLAIGLWLRSRSNDATDRRLDFDFLPDLDHEGDDANLDELNAFHTFSLLIMAGERPANRGKLIHQIEDELERLLLFAVDGFVERWQRGTITPDDPAGLLWLFDPAYWYPAGGEPGDDVPGACLRQTARAILATIDGDPEAFFRGQLDGEDKLVDVLARVYPRRGDARAQARKVIADIELLADTLGGLLDKAVRLELKRLPWFEVLLHLVHAGVIDPPALRGSYDFDGDEEEPVQARWMPAGSVVPEGGRTIVELFVVPAGQKVVIERVHDLAVPVERTFAWEYLEDAAQGPTLLVVAGPGVRITPPEEARRGWNLEILRVQSFNVIPPWGERIDRSMFLSPYTMASPANIDGDALLLFTPRADGLTIRHPANNEEDDFWELELTVDLWSPDHRITYSLEETNPPERRGLEEPLLDAELLIATSPGVHMRYTASLLFGEVVGEFDPADLAFYWGSPFGPGIVGLYQGAITALPSPGFAHEAELFDRIETRVPDETVTLWQGFVYDAAAMAFDTVIGFIPIVGDVADGLELFTIVVTGKDKWGRPAGALDFMLTAGGMVLPFVSSAFLRQLGRKGLDVVTEAIP